MFLHGGRLADKGTPTAGSLGSWVVTGCAALDGSKIVLPSPFRYFLLRGEDGLELFEQSPDTSGSIVTNQWKEADGTHFYSWVTSNGWEFIIPGPGQPGLRRVYSGTGTTDKHPGGPFSATCPMTPIDPQTGAVLSSPPPPPAVEAPPPAAPAPPPPPPPPPAPTPVAAAAGRSTPCVPACRTGFLCAPTGQCISACNPPCESGERCTASGNCVTDAPAPVARASAEPASAASACVPACRRGYVCSPAGRCVSACNPPCDAQERCTDAGTCESSSGAAAAASTKPNCNPSFTVDAAGNKHFKRECFK